MLPILLARFSTTISGLFRVYARSLPSAGSWACVHCGLKVSAQRTDGTSGLSFAIDLQPPNLSHSKHSVVLTPDGKLLILCESETSDSARSEASGMLDGIYSSPKNSSRTQREAIYTADNWRLIGMTIYDHAHTCGCDPVADHMCLDHIRTVNALRHE